MRKFNANDGLGALDTTLGDDEYDTVTREQFYRERNDDKKPKGARLDSRADNHARSPRRKGK